MRSQQQRKESNTAQYHQIINVFHEIDIIVDGIITPTKKQKKRCRIPHVRQQDVIRCPISSTNCNRIWRDWMMIQYKPLNTLDGRFNVHFKLLLNLESGRNLPSDPVHRRFATIVPLCIRMKWRGINFFFFFKDFSQKIGFDLKDVSALTRTGSNGSTLKCTVLESYRYVHAKKGT